MANFVTRPGAIACALVDRSRIPEECIPVSDLPGLRPVGRGRAAHAAGRGDARGGILSSSPAASSVAASEGQPQGVVRRHGNTAACAIRDGQVGELAARERRLVVARPYVALRERRAIVEDPELVGARCAVGTAERQRSERRRHCTRLERCAIPTSPRAKVQEDGLRHEVQRAAAPRRLWEACPADDCRPHAPGHPPAAAVSDIPRNAIENPDVRTLTEVTMVSVT